MKYPNEPISGIIILGGSYDTQIRSYLSTVTFGENTEPMALVAGLARRYPEAKVIFSGGSEPLTLGPSEAAVARQLFISFGIDPNRILIEDRSRNTEENARFTLQMIHPAPQSKWLLVTSAFHMPRAIGAFRQAGFNVVAFPAGWRTHGWRDFFGRSPRSQKIYGGWTSPRVNGSDSPSIGYSATQRRGFRGPERNRRRIYPVSKPLFPNDIHNDVAVRTYIGG